MRKRQALSPLVAVFLAFELQHLLLIQVAMRMAYYCTKEAIGETADHCGRQQSLLATETEDSSPGRRLSSRHSTVLTLASLLLGGHSSITVLIHQTRGILNFIFVQLFKV